jgi:hypothetical protein
MRVSCLSKYRCLCGGTIQPCSLPCWGAYLPSGTRSRQSMNQLALLSTSRKNNLRADRTTPSILYSTLNRLECNANNQWCWCVRGPSNTTRTDKEAPCFSTYLVYQSLSDSQYLHWQVCIQRFNRIRLYSDLIWFDYAWVFSSCWPTDLLISSGVLRRISSLLLDPLWLWYSVPA